MEILYNPFLQEYKTIHGVHPFDKIKLEHYKPAFEEGMRRQNDEIERIVNNDEKPTFSNTIVALEHSGELLERVCQVFFNLMEAESSDDMQILAQEISPILTEHSNNISLNEQLFLRIKSVYENELGQLQNEDRELLQKTYDSFVRNGANLHGEDRECFRELSMELSKLTVQFAQNTLKEMNAFQLVITNEDELKGLPESSIEAAAQLAEEKGVKGWIFTLHAPSYRPFMTYCADRELRRKMYMAYMTQCTHDNDNNNMDIVVRIVNTRMKIAQILGYDTYADYVLKKRMAEKSENVYHLLYQLIEAYTPTARHEMEEVRNYANQLEGHEVDLMPWDWAYYSEKLKNEKYSIDQELLRPYFELKNVIDGVFGLATRLYGITFKENKDIPVFHPDVKTYEVFDKDGSFLAVLYADFYPRETKQSGAWMTSFKDQWIEESGVNSRPHISITTNFTKPTASKPALLTLSEVETFLHEFGHALHGMFANTRYASMSGTSVYRDFVELPSQIMENFAIQKDFLHTFAKHYQTGELLPDEYVERIVKASNFNVAYACLRQVSFGLLDMAWYTRSKEFSGDVKAYEEEAWSKAQLFAPVPSTCMSVQFSHIMDGGYSAGYYGYKWAEVLDADAFSVFREKGIFNREVADSFRENILSKGGTEHPMVLYKRFRGQEPSIEALLVRNGIITK